MRRGVRVGVVFVIAVAVLAAALPGLASADIADGGFESGVLRDAPTIDPSFGVWTRQNPSAQLVNPPLPVHSGQWALQVDTMNEEHGSAVFQDFDSGTLSYDWTFWLRPEAGRNVAEIVYNWDRGAGYAEFGTEFLFQTNSTRFRGWGGAAYIPPASFGAWHEVKVVADRCTGTQDAFLDGTAWGRVQTFGAPPAGVSTIILGDVAYIALRGRYHFDDVSFQLWDCSQPRPHACPLSQGFWKNHPAAWPVDHIVLGNETYSKSELLALLRTPSKGDASLILAHQLIAAKLNIANGSDPEPVKQAVAEADSLLGAFSGTLPYGVRPSSPPGKGMTATAGDLDAYNNGGLTPGCSSTDDDGPLPPRPKLPPKGIRAPLGAGAGDRDVSRRRGTAGGPAGEARSLTAFRGAAAA